MGRDQRTRGAAAYAQPMAHYPSLQDRVVLITGGGRGLGQVMTLALVAEGARVMITASRAPQDLAETLAAAEAINPGACATLVADVTDAAACEAAVAATIAAFGRIDVLINNAARPAYEAAQAQPGQRQMFWEADVQGYQTLVDTNFVGPFLMARAAAPHMVQAGFGKIINISTSRSTMVLQSGGPYGACKAGLEANSVTWAKDLEGSGVTVNVLLPGGPADTALIPGTVGGRAIPGFQAGKGPLGQEGAVVGGLLPPEIMGPPVLWLCADESNGYNGRRVVARDWDPELPPAEAAANAMQPKAGPPLVM
jgi:NAD(P)-dependent dehydrogenase (short-subunit alcohol dehydrogenase family)